MIKNPFFWCLLLFVLLSIPALMNPYFVEDDFIQMGVAEGVINYPSMGPWEHYQFLDGNPDHLNLYTHPGPLPWYTHPYAKVKFFRPLPSLLTTFFHRYFGLKVFPYRILNLICYFFLLLSLYFFLKRLIFDVSEKRNSLLIGVSLFIFVLSSIHSVIIMYSAMRWMLVSITLTLTGVTAHLKWQQEQWKLGPVISILAFSLGLLSGEAALSILIFLLVYELIVAKGKLWARVLRLMPATILIAIYLAFYSLGGYGSAGQDFYLSPISRPFDFLVAFPSRYLAMMGDLVLGIGSYRWYQPSARWISTLAGLGAIMVISILMIPVWREARRKQKKLYRWIVVCILASMVPLASRTPSSHIFIIPLMGLASLLAIIFYWWGKRILRRPIVPILPVVALALYLAVVHLVISPTGWFTNPQRWQRGSENFLRFHEQEILTQLTNHKQAIFLNALRYDLLFNGYYLRKLYRMPMPSNWWVLSTASHNHRYTRTGANVLELEILNGSLLDSEMHTALRSRRAPLQRGEEFDLGGITITIIETDHLSAKKIRFQFGASLDSDRYHFFGWEDGEFKTFDPPLVGQSLTLTN